MAVVSGSSTANNNKTGTGTSQIRCERCGLLFDSIGAKEEHVKLEHVEHKQPSGVG
jgi:uncharacterized C2H2 Zn-finger protein